MVALSSPNSLIAQQTGTIRGTVQSSITGEPLSGVVVTLIQTGVEIRTDEDGQFLLRQVGAGSARLRLDFPPNFVTSIEDIAVRPGVTTRVFMEMTPVAVVLDELRVRGRPAPSDADVRRFTPAEARAVSGGGTAVDLLTASFSGIQVTRGSGQAGSGTRILIRGINSLNLPGDPLVFVDGVRVGQSLISQGSEASYVVGFLDMIQADQVSRIEILKGPSATKFGVGSSNGVILIYTR